MKSDVSGPVCFTSEEKNLIQDTHFFETKVRVTQKIKTLLHQLKPEIEKEARALKFLSPQGFDPENFQFVKGEHLRDFPYLYLDFPKHFNRTEKFSFRTLFWWGHYFIFSWILEGQYLDHYKKNLLTQYDVLSDQGLSILLTDTLWEWRKNPEFLLEIKSGNKKEVEDVLAGRPFLKIHRYLAFDQPSLLEGTLLEEAMDSFRKMSSIVQRDSGHGL